MNTSRPPIDEFQVWADLLASASPGLPAALAADVLTWVFTDAEKQRMAVLAAEAREGTLSVAEQNEADIYGRVASVLGILKSKARQSQRRESMAAA